jgi:heptosyltransferase-2
MSILVQDCEDVSPRPLGGQVRPAGPAGPLPDLRACRKILVVKLDFVGDWVLTLPFLAVLRRHAPRAEITAVVLDRVFDLAARCRLVDRVVAVRDGRAVTARGRSTAETLAFLTDYRSGAFDLALVPRWDADFNGAAPLAHGSRARAVVGFAEACTRRRRRINAGYDRYFTHVLDHRAPAHETEQNLRLLDLFGRYTTSEAILDTGEKDDRAAANILRAAFPGAARPVLALAPFASEAKRMLPLARISQLGRWLADRYDVNIAIIGNSEHAGLAGGLAAACGARAASLCGTLSLPASAALLRRSVALIGMDSGPAHMAAAVGAPVAVLSCHPLDGKPGHENAPQRFAPWGNPAHILILQPPAALAPCAGACSASTAHCISTIPEATLRREIDLFIARALQRSSADPESLHWLGVQGLPSYSWRFSS